MKKELILDRLKNDEDYYGDFGKQFLSNSNISTLLTNPLALKEPQQPNINFLIGGYFHTAILEPDKLKSIKLCNPQLGIQIYTKKYQVARCAYYNMKLTN